jgi:hypothetical protein
MERHWMAWLALKKFGVCPIVNALHRYENEVVPSAPQAETFYVSGRGKISKMWRSCPAGILERKAENVSAK